MEASMCLYLADLYLLTVADSKCTRPAMPCHCCGLPAGKISTLADMKRVLRSNGWPRDSLSVESPWDAICARGDLDPGAPDAYGCFDGKVTSYK